MTRDEKDVIVAIACLRMLQQEIDVNGVVASAKQAYLLVRLSGLMRRHPVWMDKRQDAHEMCAVLIHSAVDALARLTPRQLTTTFPVEKRYDGARWEIKDYFSTMEALAEHHTEQPIGTADILDFLWDYENQDIRELLVAVCCIAGENARREGKKDPFDLFFQSPRYTASDGAQYVSDYDGTPVMVKAPRLTLA